MISAGSSSPSWSSSSACKCSSCTISGVLGSCVACGSEPCGVVVDNTGMSSETVDSIVSFVDIKCELSGKTAMALLKTMAKTVLLPFTHHIRRKKQALRITVVANDW
ncbi:hypothetical protein D918_06550 [Trichuris suis]|nr:hypothetical protein D918_06550 [Trichuris suis]